MSWSVLYAPFLQEGDRDPQGEKFDRVFVGFCAATSCLLISARCRSEYLICRAGAGDGGQVVKSRWALAPSPVSDCAGILDPRAAEGSAPTLDLPPPPPPPSTFKTITSRGSFQGFRPARVELSEG